MSTVGFNAGSSSAASGNASARGSAPIAKGQAGAQGEGGDLFAQLLGLPQASLEVGRQSDGIFNGMPEDREAYWFDLYDQLKGLADGQDWVFNHDQPLLDQLPPEGQYRVLNVVNQLGSTLREQVIGMMRTADGLQDVSVQMARQSGQFAAHLSQPMAADLMPASSLAGGTAAASAGTEQLNFMQAMERIMANAMTPVTPELHKLDLADGQVSSLHVSLLAQSAQNGDGAARAEWAPVKMDANQQQWGQQMVSVLKERVELQMKQDVQQARIRLDPPHLGALELSVRMEEGKMTVQINAADPALREALQQSVERLRAELEGKQLAGGNVNVDVGDSSPESNPEQATPLDIAANPLSLDAESVIEPITPTSSLSMLQRANRVAHLV
ncbi:flagellar hook-length control protein FliK [Thaumasiovibrio sp. DFM-14]|uniref:flagellar hook-length control protein FliK n=1 Tax=Thaumasiovibrio sp. DFM-14 TaxID=3384792 RepID=UPI0039A354EE